MIRVRVSAPLIEQALATGNQVRALTVTEGIPPGCTLVGAKIVGEVMELEFADPGSGPDREIQITLTTHVQR